MDVHSVLLRSASVLFKHQLLKAGPNEQPTETPHLAHQIITQTIEAFEFDLRRRRRGLQVRHGFKQAMLRREFVRRQQRMRSC